MFVNIRNSICTTHFTFSFSLSARTCSNFISTTVSKFISAALSFSCVLHKTRKVPTFKSLWLALRKKWLYLEFFWTIFLCKSQYSVQKLIQLYLLKDVFFTNVSKEVFMKIYKPLSPIFLAKFLNYEKCSNLRQLFIQKKDFSKEELK